MNFISNPSDTYEATNIKFKWLDFSEEEQTVSPASMVT